MTRKPTYEELEKRVKELEQAESERKRVAEAFHEQQHLLEIVINELPFWFSLKDEKGRYLLVNQKMAEAHGVTVSDFINHITMQIPELHPGGLMKMLERDNQVLKTGERIEMPEYPIKTVEGLRWRRLVKIPWKRKTGEVIGVISWSEDITNRKRAEEELVKYRDHLEELVDQRTAELQQEITERKQAEASLRESQATFLTLLECMEATVYVADMETYEILFMNKYMKDSFGADFTGKICWEELRNESGPCDHCTNDKLLDEEGNPAGVQVWNDQNPVTGKWYINYDRVIKWTDGRYVRLQVATDITDLKIMEEQLRQAQKMEAIGALAGGIAHDFNNLLTTIIGNAEIALMDVIKDEFLRGRIEEIKKAGERAASLTRQLLTFSRKQVIKPEVLDLNEVINETEKMLKHMIGEDIEFQTILKPELWKVHMDSGQIDQIIINIAVNARDAMPQGGKLTIETTNVDLDKAYFRDHGAEGKPGPYVMLAISDTGSGMDKETREHIFEPFFTTKEIGKGTGLGLSTVYGIAKQNNGFIWVYSEPGQGTTFKIYLPRVKEGAEPEEKERTPVLKLGGSGTVLIVEDDDSLRKLARTVLKQRGYKVLEAENGDDALRVSKEHDGSIHLLITDVVMPKMGGREVAEQLQPLYPQMKVIYMSGYTDNAIVHHGILADGLNFLEKPFSPGALALEGREVLDK